MSCRHAITKAMLPAEILGRPLLAWSSTLRFSFNGTFVVRMPPPSSGWTAYFLEVIHFGGLPQFYTTQVFITPGVLPFDVPLEQATVCPE